VDTPAGTFFAAPYLQLGDSASDATSLTVAWHTKSDEGGEWVVETRPASGGGWIKHAPPARREVAVGGVPAHTVWSAEMTGLAPGVPFDYRLLRGGTPVFAARARARKAPGSAFRFVAFGDCADGGNPSEEVAFRTSLVNPDFVLVTGDIVYPHGRASEYQKVFWPVYNADAADAKVGAPLMRSIPFVGVSGNHDLAYANLGKYPDGLAYYHYWLHPLNGPALSADDGAHTPPVSGPAGALAAFRRAAGPNFPRSANFSFDYGGAHFTVIDSNYYTDWTDPALVRWLESDLAAAKDAAWKFVSFHVPPFSSTRFHQEEQWMRVLSPVLEKHGVDVVLSGHVHNYQRTHPLRFAPVLGLTGEYRDPRGRVSGEFQYDTAFDGKTATLAQGVIYVVTGGGGAALYKGTVGGTGTLQPYTAKYVEDTHSFTVADVAGKVMTVRQLDEDGKELDRWSVAKP
jgi:predicted phosphodiesterase